MQKPGGTVVSFEYDALGRRIAKICKDTITRYVWDGNVLLHEWRYALTERPVIQVGELGELLYDKAEPVENVITWVYEEGSFTPLAKLVNGERFSIVSDYLGTPIQAYDSAGELIWSTDYDIYGKLKNQKGEKQLVPFRQPGQYEDEELGGLYCNRFRYYDSQTGLYISQDPIGLAGGNPTMYGYVFDSNTQVDVFGLNCGNGLDIRPAKIVEEIKHGAKINEIVSKALYETRAEGVEHALIKLTDGKRYLVSGGRHGIILPENTKYIYGHTHPPIRKGELNTPSSGDREALDLLDQSKQYIFHDGQRTTIYKGKDSSYDVITTNY